MLLVICILARIKQQMVVVVLLIAGFQLTVKPVSRGHLWDKEKVVL